MLTALYGYDSQADLDLFTTLDYMAQIPNVRLVSVSSDRAWFTPWLMWWDGWCCPWSPS